MPSKKKSEPGFSRRTFLKTVGAGGVAAGVIGPPSAAEAQAIGAVGPGPVRDSAEHQRHARRNSRSSRA